MFTQAAGFPRLILIMDLLNLLKQDENLGGFTIAANTPATLKP